MPRRSRLAARLTLWLFAGALVLKSAVPLMAAGAAALQGKAVAEICDVYGVDMAAFVRTAATPVAVASTGAMAAMPPADAMAHHHHGHAHGDASAAMPHGVPTTADVAPAPSHHHGSQAGDHCALTGMVAIATGEAPALAALAVAAAVSARLPPLGSDVFDATAQWAARLEHGPPAGA